MQLSAFHSGSQVQGRAEWSSSCRILGLFSGISQSRSLGECILPLGLNPILEASVIALQGHREGAMPTSVEEETRAPRSSPTNPPILLRTGLQCPQDALLALAPAAAQDGAGLRETRGRGLRQLSSQRALCSVASGADVTRHPPLPRLGPCEKPSQGACTPLLGRPGSWHVPSLGSSMVMGAEGMPGAHPRLG